MPSLHLPGQICCPCYSLRRPIHSTVPLDPSSPQLCQQRLDFLGVGGCSSRALPHLHEIHVLGFEQRLGSGLVLAELCVGGLAVTLRGLEGLQGEGEFRACAACFRLCLAAGLCC